MFEGADRGRKVDKAEFAERLPPLRVDLVNAQFDLRRADFSVLLVVEGDDLIGCNEVLNDLPEVLDGRYLRLRAMDPPGARDRERPALWRYWRELPRRGQIGVLAYAWTQSVIRDRLAGRLDESGYERRLAQIRAFEATLAAEGALLIKLWLHLPKKAARKRLERAERDPDLAWRIDEEDRRIFRDHDDVLRTADEVLRATDAPAAPWHVIETTDSRYRRLAVAESLRAALCGRLEGASRPATGRPTPLASGDAAPEEGLAALDLSARLTRDVYRRRLRRRQGELHALARTARQQGIATVLVFEGWDAAGKGGVIRRITRALDARDYRVIPVSAPSPEERDHHYLWRFWRDLPRSGRTAIFDRSWYGRVLVERVEGLASEEEWRRAYGEIADFESQLYERGVVLVKFWLHIDPGEQLARFRAREETPYKKYKLTPEDWRNRDRWGAYERAVDEMVARTSTPEAPWQLVAANDKRWARVQVLKACCKALRRVL